MFLVMKSFPINDQLMSDKELMCNQYHAVLRYIRRCLVPSLL